MNMASMNQSIAKPMNTVSFKVGARFTATVKAVHESGVNIVMPGEKGSGLISPKCWGEGARRRAALAAIKPGDKLPVTVVKFYPQTTMLLLALDNSQRKRKPDYALIAPGTTLLVDGANVIGKLGTDDSANIIRTIRAELESRGFKAVVFLEHRAYTFLKCNQESEAKKDEFVQLVENGGVSLVNGEADLVILQCARQIPGAVAVSDDTFADYRNVFGDIVSTPRVRRFTWTEIAGRRFLSIDGLADAIEIRKAEVPVTAVEVEESPETPVEKSAATRHLRPDAPCGRDAVLALGSTMLAKGDAKKAFDCFDLAVRKGSPDGYRAMAYAYESGDGVVKDAKRAEKFSKLAEKLERKARDRQRRIARKFAMVRDGAFAMTHDHMSANDIVACSLLACRLLEKDIRAHRRATCISRDVVHGRAA